MQRQSEREKSFGNLAGGVREQAGRQGKGLRHTFHTRTHNVRLTLGVHSGKSIQQLTVEVKEVRFFYPSYSSFVFSKQGSALNLYLLCFLFIVTYLFLFVKTEQDHLCLLVTLLAGGEC